VLDRTIDVRLGHPAQAMRSRRDQERRVARPDRVQMHAQGDHVGQQGEGWRDMRLAGFH